MAPYVFVARKILKGIYWKNLDLKIDVLIASFLIATLLYRLLCQFGLGVRFFRQEVSIDYLAK